jgi:spore germination cell wall hydrolase CwlJ-like protein
MTYVGNNPVNWIDPYGLLSNEDINWVARTLYGEFSGYKPIYQETAAWVIRNRLDSGKWGDTYEEVVTARKQFSCFRKNDPNYKKVMDPNPKGKRWNRAVESATTVLNAPESANPIPGVMYYYSPRSMTPPGTVPDWAKGRTTIKVKGIYPWHMTLIK